MAPMNNRLMRPRASGGFDPKSISGLALWLDGTKGVFDANTGGSASTDGGAVGRWEDQSGNGRHFTQSDGNNRPTYRAVGLNGKPVVDFNGSNNRLKADLPILAQPNTLFIVASNDDGGLSQDGQQHLLDGTGTRTIFLRSVPSEAGVFCGAGPIVDVAAFSNSTTYRVFTAFCSGASSYIRTDGALTASGNPSTTGFGGTGCLLGCGFGEATAFWDGKAAEILVYNKSLTDAERNSVEKYLGTKWGITVA